jgi:hypothetical protein
LEKYTFSGFVTRTSRPSTVRTSAAGSRAIQKAYRGAGTRACRAGIHSGILSARCASRAAITVTKERICIARIGPHLNSRANVATSTRQTQPDV